MTPGRIAMRPVDHPTFRTPLVLAAEFHRITRGKISDPRSEVDVVRDQNGETRGNSDEELLMPAAIVVVCKDPGYLSLPLHLQIALSPGKCLIDCGVAPCPRCRTFRGRRRRRLSRRRCRGTLEITYDGRDQDPND